MSSVFGIASFVIAVVGGLALFVLFAIAGYLEVTTPGGVDEKSAVAIFLGLGLILVWAVVLVGLILDAVRAEQRAVLRRLLRRFGVRPGGIGGAVRRRDLAAARIGGGEEEIGGASGRERVGQ